MAKKKKPMTLKEMQSLGGKARAAKMTKEERADSARKASQARWAKMGGAPKKAEK